MRKFKFKGDGPVDVPALGLVDLTPNSVVEVEDTATADAMDASNLWEHIPDPARSRAAKKAATKTAVAEHGVVIRDNHITDDITTEES